MADVTVMKLAETVKMPVERLCSQLVEAGLPAKKANDMISEQEKLKLLEFLRQSHGKKGGTLGAGGGAKKLSLKKRKSVSEIKVAGAAGRGRTVSVEVRNKRSLKKEDSVPVEITKTEAEELRLRELEAERLKRLEADKAGDDARQSKERERRDGEAEAKKAIEDAKIKAEEEAKAIVAAAAEAERLKNEVKVAAEETTPAAKPKPAEDTAKKRVVDKKKRPARRGATTEPGKLHLAPGKSGRKRKKGGRRQVEAAAPTHVFEKPTAPVIREVTIGETVKVSDLALRMAVKSGEVIKVMMQLGVMATINQVIDQETAQLVVEEMGHTVKLVSDEDTENTLLDVQVSDADANQRPPVITIMGHVDHGKTSLLDYIRESRVASGEAGGITQHIGAYQIDTDIGTLTFLDTPGHAAFTAMRARGAKATDIVVLVVAADDGVMPQTIEAVKHAKAAGVPIVVAVNKIDKEDADPERVKTELSSHDVIAEEWGGDTVFVPVSAHTGEGVDALLEALNLQAEVMELSAVSDGAAQGVVIESTLDKGRGPVSTVLVQSGSLKKGDILLAGREFGRVRALFDEHGNTVESAGPSRPVVALGLSGTPNAGEDFVVVADERKAREAAAVRQTRYREAQLAASKPTKLEDMFANFQGAETVQTVPIVLKGDVQGSVEAIRDALNNLSTDEIKVRIVGSGVGGITESDVGQALASKATVIGFNVRADAAARRATDEAGLSLRYYNVIYDVIDDIKAAMSGLLSPEVREEIIGLAEVKDVFRSSKLGSIAGSMVTEGVIRKSSPIRVLRDSVVIYEGELESLRRFKDDVKEVRSGTECGIGVKNYNDVQPGDQIEVFERTEIARTID